ncbi:MAG TPA: VWA domain-containing protein, partial [Vicinamibacterales bacterium]
MLKRASSSLVALLLAAGVLLSAQAQSAQPPQDPQSFKFRTGVELVNVNATVTDQSGRFVSGLNKDDFRLFDDEQLQAVTHFSAERVPVSLGIVLDTSGSMDGDKIVAARLALDRFLSQLNDPNDEVFLYRFDNAPELIEGWTHDKRRISESLGRIMPKGSTALYDAVTDAVRLAQQGHNRKKAVVILSDGNDTSSHTDIFAVKQLIRETEVLVYAIGIDAQATVPPYVRHQPLLQRGGPVRPIPLPFPMPGGKRPPASPPPPVPQPPPGPVPGGGGSGGGSRPRGGSSDDRVNVAALRDITDDSGGRTEIVRWTRDLDPAVAGIADELSKQYYLGYSATGVRDGRWHAIRVEVRQPSYHVRARRGYVAG